MRPLMVLAFLLLAFPARAAPDDPAPSLCMAVADAIERTPGLPVVKAAFAPLAAAGSGVGEVTITYAGHSTYVIETPAGVRIATDFSGAHGTQPTPRIVTMNKAHATHFTPVPDPAIEHVLRGWSDDGSPAKHRLVVEDAYVRNVPTDIRLGDAMEENGNSIFIFEVADLCIGHLGHLHHHLTDAHYAAIGRLDIVMVPVDGGLTLSHEGMSAIVKRLQSSLVLPMHRRFTTMEAFLARVGEGFAIEYSDERSVTVSARTLPRRPTILVLAGL